MTKIVEYSASSQNSGGAAKGTASNPYTQAEYETMLNNGTWSGGYVEGLGYCMSEIVVTDSYPNSDDSWPSYDSWSSDYYWSSDDFWSSSYSWPSDDSWQSDDDSQSGNGTTTTGDSDTGGNTTGNGDSNDSGSDSHSGGGTSTGYNVSKAVTYLVSHAYPTYINGKCGHCARAVREALEAGGLSTIGHPTSACDYDSFLPSIGFHVVSKNNYTPQEGDIIVLEAVAGHSNGHIAMYSGSKWISDFVQSDMWGGSAYRNKAEYTLFRI